VPGSGTSVTFSIEEGRRKALLLGQHHVDLTMSHADEVAGFQADDRVRRPWIYRPDRAARESRHGRA
jgi:3-isopropylmalate/(R)-2-methylmalate dehydratase small subunit